MSTGYEIDRNNRAMKQLNLVRAIQIDIAKNHIDLKQLLARILLGQTFEKIILLQKCGENGKSWLLELLLNTFGKYGHSINVNNLLNSG